MNFLKKITIVLTVGVIFFIPIAVFAQSEAIGQTIKGPVLQVKIGNSIVKFDTVSCSERQVCVVPWMAQYIRVLYTYGVGIAGILAIAMIMVGGLIWLMSGGSPDRVGKAKEFITAAVTGLFLALFSYLILFYLNPDLVNLKPLEIYRPGKVGVGEVRNGFYRGGQLVTDPTYYNTSALPPDKRGIGYTLLNEGEFLPRPKPDPEEESDMLIGYGFNMTQNPNIPINFQPDGSITQEEAMRLANLMYGQAVGWAQDFAGAEAWGQMTIDQQIALIDMAYQMGPARLSGFDDLQLAIRNAGEYELQADQPSTPLGGTRGIVPNQSDLLAQQQWELAGAAILDSEYAGQTPDRAARNAAIMSAGTMNQAWGGTQRQFFDDFLDLFL